MGRPIAAKTRIAHRDGRCPTPGGYGATSHLRRFAAGADNAGAAVISRAPLAIVMRTLPPTAKPMHSSHKPYKRKLGTCRPTGQYRAEGLLWRYVGDGEATKLLHGAQAMMD